MATRVIGLDLGQSTDNSAACVIDRTLGKRVEQQVDRGVTAWGLFDKDNGRWQQLLLPGGILKDHFKSRAELESAMSLQKVPLTEEGEKLKCVSLKMWPLGTKYDQVRDDVLSINYDILVPDYCGVGRAVVDMIQEKATRTNHKGKIRPVATVASSARAHSGYEVKGTVYHTVPKRDIVTALEIVQQDGRLALPGTEETGLLLEQLRVFQVTHSSKGRGEQQFGNVPGSGRHDDLVVATGLACWWCLNFGRARLAIHLP